MGFNSGFKGLNCPSVPPVEVRRFLYSFPFDVKSPRKCVRIKLT